MRCDHCFEKITKNDIGYAIRTEDGCVFCSNECMEFYYWEEAELLEEWEIEEEEEEEIEEEEEEEIEEEEEEEIEEEEGEEGTMIIKPEEMEKREIAYFFGQFISAMGEVIKASNKCWEPWDKLINYYGIETSITVEMMENLEKDINAIIMAIYNKEKER